MRRRLACAGAFVALAGLVAGLIVAFPSPGEQKGAKTSPGGELVKPDRPAAFTPRRAQILDVARKFVATAVARRNTGDSWNLLAPTLKQGYTKKSWSKGDIPVVPFPVYFGRWRLGYSFADEVDLKVALFARPKTKLRPVVFDLTLNRFIRNGRERWLVSSFVPAPVAGGDFGTRASRYTPRGFAALQRQEKVLEAKRTSGTWLFLPGGIVFGLILLVLSLLAIRGWRGKRTYRAYVRDRQISSSRPS